MFGHCPFAPHDLPLCTQIRHATSVCCAGLADAGSRGQPFGAKAAHVDTMNSYAPAYGGFLSLQRPPDSCERMHAACVFHQDG